MKEEKQEKYNKDKLAVAQRASFEIILEVDRICRKYGITYLLDAGTLLGAVRHKGFIPWDDDVDIAFTRKNFEKFLEHREEINRKFSLVMPEDFSGGERFFDFIPRIMYNSSVINLGGIFGFYKSKEALEYYEGKLNHLWVDIFILDNASDSHALDALTRFRLKVLYGMAMRYRYEVDWCKFRGLEKAEVKVLYFLGRFMKMPEIFRRYGNLSVKYNKKKTSRMYYSNYQPDWLGCSVERDWSETSADREFEGKMLMCPKESEKVLTMLYGDYNTLPPEEERMPSHSEDIEVIGG